mmetsp:Transcript_3149/g.4876  ORF Transcript_3149/g.4876 Transcript_3149/m.4876 type:complete len:2519 (-) Transcript_3149:278-7834(-)
MAALLFYIFLFLSQYATVESSCETFNTKCSATIGTTLSSGSSGEEDFLLDKHGTLYFAFNQPENSPSVKILTSINYGNIEIFAAIGKRVSPTSYDLKADRLQDVCVVNANGDSSSRVVNVLIRATTSAMFRVIATTSSTHTSLKPGAPQVDTIRASGQNMYKFTALSTASMYVVVTPYVSGDPDLLVTGPRINGNARTWESSEEGADSVMIIPTDAEVGGTFTVTVTATNSSLYMILASESTTTHPSSLLGGFPLEDYAEAGTNLYYTLQVPAGHADVLAMVTPVYGDADIFVNTAAKGFYTQSEDGSSQPATWDSQHSFGTDSVIIDHTHSAYQADGGEYYITVYARKACRFVVRGFSAATVVTLSEGSPIIDTVSAGSYHYYRFLDNTPSQDVVFDVSPLSGDPDLLVGCQVDPTGDDSGYPSKAYQHHNYSSVRSGEDGLLVRQSDTHACRNGVYYLAVYAFTASRFSLTSTHQGGLVTLQDGVPVQAQAYAGIPRYFRFTMGPEPMQLTISLTPSTGDTDLFVKLGGSVSQYTWDYYSVNGGTAVDQVIIPETEVCTNCEVSILVTSMTMTPYSIVASLEDTTIQLADAVPLKESVAWNAIQYYTLHSASNGTARVVLTVLSGAPELYISTSEEKPTRTSPDTVVNTMAAIGNLPVSHIPVKPGEVLYIGVGGAGSNASYTVRANLREAGVEPLLRLPEAMSQADNLDRDGPQWNFYQINMPAGHESITLRATPLVGNVDVYILRCPYQTSECAGTHGDGATSYLPTMSSYDVTTAGQEKDFVTVSRNDDTGVSYIVGVMSDSLYAEYHISMSLESSILVLSPGTPVTDHAEKGEYDYFSVYAEDTPQQLSLTLTPLSGDADMYIATDTRRPNRTHSTWTSMRFGEDVVTIDTELDEKACTGCTYYVAVYGYEASTYSLMASTQSTVGRLLDGVPISAHVDMFGYVRYTFRNTYGIARNFRVVLTVLSGSPSLYITLDGRVPSFTEYDYHSNAWMTSSVTIQLAHTDERYAPCVDADCDIRIAVYGLVSSSYTLSITSSKSSTLLQMGVPVQAEVAELQVDYFKVLMSDTTATLKVSLNEYSGVAVMYLSCHHEFPNSTAFDWYLYPANRNSGNYIEVSRLESIDKSCPSTGEFYASVKGLTSSTYSIMASITGNVTAQRLIPGTVVNDAVGFHEFDYFFYRPQNANDKSNNLEITLTALQGDVDVYVSPSWERRPFYSPSTDEVMSFALRSAEIGNDNLLIRRSDMRDMCGNHDPDCYIIIGVYGSYDGGGVGSTYRLELTLQDTTRTLSSGVAVRSHLDQHEIDYYKYTVTAPDKDVVIVVTPFSGDPDMFVSLAPNRHPSYANYTWMTAFWGADTLTIQHSDLSEYCVPVPSEGKNCELFIAIYGWQNCSYSIVAQMDEGALHPVALVDGQPQSGHVALGSYAYYTFFINDHDHSLLPAGLTITLTSTDGGDQDIYLLFSDEEEPGKNHFDYASTNFAGVSDEVRVSAGDAHYCINCMVHIAVFGFKPGHYSIVATSRNVQELQSGVAVGGHLEQGQYRYYSVRNTNPTAQISVSLTPVNGDPDIYMNIYSASSDGTPYAFPTTSRYTWRSIHAGNDEVSFNYADENFCVDCTYVVGIYSYRNSSYTLLLTNTDDAVVSLVSNRPQLVHVRDVSKLRYFRVESGSSSEDVTVSVTNLGSAHLVMYMQKYPLASYNGSLPSPTDPSSYSYTTLHSGMDHIYAPGPNNAPQIYVVGVHADVATSFSIVVSSSARPVLLQSGVPQSHYVKQGAMEQFTYYMDPDVDIQVSISAVSGDPDIFLSTALPPPVCYSSAAYWHVSCYNYTWSSTSYTTDQVVISKDYPCSAIMPGTHVVDSCNPATVLSSGILHVGVYGYSTSRFLIMATRRGGHITLLPGKPQLAYTGPGFVCSSRNKESGVCQGSSTHQTRVEVAYFSFRIDASSKNPNENSVMFTVLPKCNTTRSSDEQCMPGCDCAPVGIYVISCSASNCKASDKYPSYLDGTHMAGTTITSASPSMVLSPNVVGTSTSAYCNPYEKGEACMYYIAVISRQTVESVAFTVAAETPSDVSFISCDSTPSPDGIRLTRSTTLPHADAKFYELCSKASGSDRNRESLFVTAEQCSGTLDLYACSDNSESCDSILPTEKSWQFHATSEQTCERKSLVSSPVCSATSSSVPTLELPERNGNYHIKVNGTGEFYFTVQNSKHGEQLSPSLRFDGIDQIVGGKMTIERTSGSTMRLYWHHIRVLMPGEPALINSPNIRYKLYVFERSSVTRASSPYALILSTPCGLDHAAGYLSSSGGVKVVSLPSIQADDPGMSHEITGLKKNTEYLISLVAVCDSNCLRQVSKIASTTLLSCNGAVECKPQTHVYPVASASTSSHSDSTGTNDSSSLDGVILTTLVIVIAVSMTLLGVVYYYMKNKKEMDALSDFEMTDFSSGSSDPSTTVGDIRSVFGSNGSQPATSKGPSSPNGGASGPRAMMSRMGLEGGGKSLFSSYAPLIKDEEQEDEEVTINL